LRNLEIEQEESKPKKSGLLTPIKSFMRKTDDKKEKPIFTVRKSWDLLNSTRNKINGNNA